MNPQPDRFFHLSLILLVVLNLVPHMNDHTTPTLAVGGFCLCWRLLYEYQYVPLPGFLVKSGLVVVLTYLVYMNYGRILGLESGSALLICAVSLKLIDRVGYRDAMILLFLNFMLLLARFFQSQTLGITIFATFDLIIATALLVQLHNGSRIHFNFITLLKTGAKLFLQITPVMFLLFFIFPRFSTNLIGLQFDRYSRMSGFGKTLEPGSLSSVAQNNRLAFHARFFGDPPSTSQMYWRGATINRNDGMKWEYEEEAERRQIGFIDLKKKPEWVLTQEILMEPLFDGWLFAMDQPLWIHQKNMALQQWTMQTIDSDFVLKESYDKKFVYHAYSSLSGRKWELMKREKAKYLQSPAIKDPRVLDLVNRIKKGNVNHEDMANRLMVFYKDQFRYTLKPGTMKGKSIGEFLFEKKKGFCEHFAVSFASVMRLAGVPSRVVIGFQGGTRNEISDYYLVTNQDAHAWTEIWSEQKKKWLRFDPTSVVAPLRLELGGQMYHSLSEDQLLQAQSEGGKSLVQWNTSWFGRSRLAFDALSTRWNLFLLKYDSSGQAEFFKRFGFRNINQNALLTISLLLLLGFFLWVRLRTRTPLTKKDVAEKAYLRLRFILAKRGIEKEVSEGPSDFLIRCQKEFPGQKSGLETFRKAYLSQHYGKIESGYDFNKVPWKMK